MLKKIFITFLFLIFIFMSLYITISSAEGVSITQENLNNSLQKLAKPFSSIVKNCKISVASNTITVSGNNKNYTVKYSLGNTPTFSIEVPIEKGISYENYVDRTDELLIPLLGYAAVADMEGINFDELESYMMDLYIGRSLTPKTADKTNDFSEKVVEYVNTLFANKQTLSDKLKSYEIKIEKKESNENKVTLLSTVSVNPTNVKKISSSSAPTVGTSVQSGTASPASQPTPTTTPATTSGNKASSTKSGSNDKTTSDNNIPYTGMNDLMVLIAIIAVVTIILGIKNNKYKDIK